MVVAVCETIGKFPVSFLSEIKFCADKFFVRKIMEHKINNLFILLFLKIKNEKTA
jgi:hypothetical protein